MWKMNECQYRREEPAPSARGIHVFLSLVAAQSAQQLSQVFKAMQNAYIFYKNSTTHHIKWNKAICPPSFLSKLSSIIIKNV